MRIAPMKTLQVMMMMMMMMMTNLTEMRNYFAANATALSIRNMDGAVSVPQHNSRRNEGPRILAMFALLTRS